VFESGQVRCASNSSILAGSELDFETSHEFEAVVVNEVSSDVSNSLGASGHLDFTAVPDTSSRSGVSLVDPVVERAESETEIADRSATTPFVHAVVNLVKVGKPVDVFALDNIVHVGSTDFATRVLTADSDALLAGNVAGGLATDGSLANEALFAVAVLGIESTVEVHGSATENRASFARDPSVARPPATFPASNASESAVRTLVAKSVDPT
jgi:hypothetical protein